MRIPLTPIITYSIGKDIPIAVERCGANRASNLRVPLEPVLRILVPEMERAVAAGGAEGAVHRVERDGVDAVDFGDVAVGGVGLPVAFEGEV